MNKQISYVELVDLVCKCDYPKMIKYNDEIYTMFNGNYYLIGNYINLQSKINTNHMKNKNIEILDEDNSFKTKYTCSELDFEIIKYINKLNERLNKLESEKVNETK